MPFPQKKPGVAVMIGIGKDKGGPSPLRSLEDKGDMPMGKGKMPMGKDAMPPDHMEPDADEMGGPSDQDADNGDPTAKAAEYTQEIASDPDVGPAFTQFLEAMCLKLRGAGGAAGDEPDYGSDKGAGGY